MRAFRIGLAVAAMAAAAGLMAATGVSYAEPAGGSAAVAVPPASSSSTPGMAFRVYHRPTARYTSHSCVIDLSAYAEFSLHTTVQGCGTTVTFSTVFERLTVPHSWSNWSCPPASESCTPDIMYSHSATAASIDFGTTVTTGGFEYEPSTLKVETVKVSLFSGPYGSGTLVGSITRDVNGDAGARLFGCKAKGGFRSAVITNNADDDFAIAQIRV